MHYVLGCSFQYVEQMMCRDDDACNFIPLLMVLLFQVCVLMCVHLFACVHVCVCVCGDPAKKGEKAMDMD